MDDNIENKFKDKELESGFTTPDNYFHDLQTAITARISEIRLREMVEKDGYKVPEQYFEQLGPRILAGLEKNASPIKKKSNIIRLWHSKFLKYGTAACFILITTFGLYFRYRNVVHKRSNTVIASSTEQTLYDDDLDEQDIIEHIESEADLQTTTSASKSEIENYILNNYSQNEIVRNL